jgi:aspartyl-tRNA(Asn)/glutamyl-tRNA(Gln) amidotransferase subunit A
MELPITIKDAAAALRSGAVTSVGLTKGFIERADRLDGQLQTFITRTNEGALAAAERADAAFAAGIDKGPLQGIPLAVKDILSTDDAPTTAQSLVSDPEWAAQGDGPAIARLRAAGAVMMGKNSTHEFACGSPDFEKPFPIPRNPWNTDYYTGGSSSGTGAGIAGGLFLGGLGTDTSGSVRFPAAYCGISAIKATYGRVPRTGCTQNGFSLDHIGPMARSAWDCGAILGVVAGSDGVDPGAPSVPVPSYLDALNGSLEGLRVGVVRKDHIDQPGVNGEMVEAFERAVAAFEAAGASVSEVVIPNYRVLADACWVNNASEKSGIYLTRFREHWEDWGRYTRVSMASMGLFLSSADFMQSTRVRRYAQKVMADIYTRYDVLLTPTAKGPATPMSAIGYPQDVQLPILTGFFSFVGLPAIAVPMGFTSEGLPVSLQIAGRPFEETTVLRAADAYQQITDWHLQTPAIMREPVAVA